MQVNSITISGNLTRDPELRSLKSGTSVCSMRIAHNDRRKDGQTGEWGDVPYFFDVTVFGKNGENCANYLSQGRGVVVQGKLTWREWQDKDDNKRQSVEILADKVQFTGAPQEAGGNGGGQGQPAAQPTATQAAAPAQQPAPQQPAAQQPAAQQPAAQQPAAQPMAQQPAIAPGQQQVATPEQPAAEPVAAGGGQSDDDDLPF